MTAPPEYLSDDVEVAATLAAQRALQFKPTATVFVAQSPARRDLIVFVVVPESAAHEWKWTANAYATWRAVRAVVPQSHTVKVARYEGPPVPYVH